MDVRWWSRLFEWLRGTRKDGGQRETAAPIEASNKSSRIIVGECEACHRPLRAKPHAIGRSQRFTCKCGHVNATVVVPQPEKPLGSRDDIDVAVRKRRTSSLLDVVIRYNDHQKSPDLAEYAVMGLGQLRFRAGLPALTEALQGRHGGVGAASAAALGRLGGDQAISALRGALSSPMLPVRRASAAALVALGWEPATESEQAALEVASGTLFRPGVNSLGRAFSLGATVVPFLRNALVHSSAWEEEEAISACSSLGRTMHATAVAPLVEGLKRRANVRLAARRALVSLGSTAVGELCVILSSDESNMQWWEGPGDLPDFVSLRGIIAAVLGDIGDPLAVPTLEALREDEDEPARLSAIAALQQIRDHSANA